MMRGNYGYGHIGKARHYFDRFAEEFFGKLDSEVENGNT